jgi:hypothetical protein
MELHHHLERFIYIYKNTRSPNRALDILMGSL